MTWESFCRITPCPNAARPRKTTAPSVRKTLTWVRMAQPPDRGIGFILQGRQHFSDTPIEQSDHFVDLLGGRNQWRTKGNPVRIEPEQQAVFQGAPADANAKCQLVGEAFLGGRVFDEFDSLE